MITFNADEIFEMAEQMERNGANYYTKAATQASGKPAEVLAGLAEMEKDHEKTFHEMRARLGAAEQRTASFDPDNQAAAYLQAATAGKVFKLRDDPSAKLTGKEDIRQILQTAIGLEKDSIVFYLGLKDLVAPDLGRDKIDEIIRQELGHIATLTEQLAAC